MKQKLYTAPEVEILKLSMEGVLCNSKEDLYIELPGVKWSEEETEW